MRIDLKLNGTSYHILVEPSCFTVVKHGKITDRESKNFGKEKETVISYPSTLSRAIETIIKEEMVNDESTINLMEYVEKHKQALEELKQQYDF